jgi:hypothetical protein
VLRYAAEIVFLIAVGFAVGLLGLSSAGTVATMAVALAIVFAIERNVARRRPRNE